MLVQKKLDNGLNVIVEEIPHVKSVTLGKAVKSDYRNGMLYLDATVTQADFITIRK